MKLLLQTFLIIVVFIINSCGSIMSPAIKYKNSSKDGALISNIKVNWNRYHLLGRPTSFGRCGGGGEQNFNLEWTSHLYGPVHIEWENAKGKKLTKDIIYRKQDFPTFTRRGPHKYQYIVLYFDQDDVEIYASDNPRIKEIRDEKSGDWILKRSKCVYDPEEIKRLKKLHGLD
jgi:hypothetical protein